eukprot:scaffold51021_cov38-Phaeocystis_antarctica.AAC.1
MVRVYRRATRHCGRARPRAMPPSRGRARVPRARVPRRLVAGPWLGLGLGLGLGGRTAVEEGDDAAPLREAHLVRVGVGVRVRVGVGVRLGLGLGLGFHCERLTESSPRAETDASTPKGCRVLSSAPAARPKSRATGTPAAEAERLPQLTVQPASLHEPSASRPARVC